MHTKRVGTVTALLAGLALLSILGAGCGGWQKFPGDRTVDLIPPAPPTNLAAMGGNQLADLTWDPSPSSDVIEYYVFVKINDATDWGDPIRVGNVTAVQITGLTNGEIYRARVQAVDGFGNLSLPENAAEATFSTLPGPASDLTITAVWQNNALALDLAWMASGSATVAGYTIFVSTDGGINWSAAIDAGDVETYLLTTFNNLSGPQTIQYATTYTVALETYDDRGLRSTRFTATSITPPAPPTALTGVGMDAQVRLYWVASASRNATNLAGAPIFSGYTVFVSINNGTSWDAGADVGNVTTAVITQNAAGIALINGQSYLFRVRARDTSSQLSIPADAAQITVQPTNVQQAPPGPVPSLTLVPGNRYIDASWTTSSGTIGWYEVSWVAGIYTSLTYPNSGVSSQFVQPNVFTYRITGLNNGTPYSVRLRAADATQTLFSSPGTVRMATPGADNVVVVFSQPGGAYRYRASLPADSTLPNALDLTGEVDGTNPGTAGIIYYTVDGSNPVISSARKTPLIANGVQDASLDSTGTFFQANTATGFATKLNLRALMPGRDFVRVKALFDPDGVPATNPPVITNDEGITGAVTYFVFDTTADSFVAFGGLNDIRRMHSADLAADGSVFVAGGQILRIVNPAVTVFTSCEIFNKDLEFFFPVPAPALGTPRTEHKSIVLDDGRVFLHGGRRQTPNLLNLAADLAQYVGAERIAEIYDPVAKTYTGVGLNNTDGTPRCLHQIVKLTDEPAASNNRVLIVGGVSYNPGGSTQNGNLLLESTSSTLVVPSGQIAASAVAVGDFVVITSGAALYDSQFVSGVTTDTNGNTVIYLEARLSAEPYPGAITIRRPSYSGCEFFEPNPGGGNPSFSNAASMPDSRFGHQASLLQDGRVLVTGGYYPPTVYNSDIELTSLIFDPTVTAPQGNWARCGTGTAGGHEDNSAKMQDKRYFHTATVLMNGKVLVAGGTINGTGYFMNSYYGNSINLTCDLFDVYGRAAGDITARPTGALQTARFFHSATLLRDGRVLIAGGIDYIYALTGATDYTATAELYDPSTETFSYTGSMLEPRWGHTATLLDDGRVLVTGGRADALPEVYDPATGKWSSTAGTLTGNHELFTQALVLTGGKVLVTGGQRPNRYDRSTDRYGAGAILPIAELWDPSSSLFTLLPNMAQQRRLHSMSLLDDGRVLVAGGEGGSGAVPTALSSTELFDPVAKTFSAGPNFSPRYGHSAVTLRPVRYYRAGTATFNGTTAVAGANTAWITFVQAGDRIRLDSDPNGAFFEIASINLVVGVETLTIRSGAGFGYAIPSGSGAYTIHIERVLAGNATFTFNSALVTGSATTWGATLTAGMVIGPTALVGGAARSADFYVIQSVDSNTQVTLTRNFTNRSSPGAVAEAFTAQGNSKVLLLGGGASGQPLSTGEIFNPINGTFESCLNTMTLGRYQHTATLLDNGWVLIVGGNSNYDRTAELFDPASKRFKFLNSTFTNASRNNHTAVRMANGYVYIAGGEVAQTVTEFFVPDSDGNAALDADGDGIAGIDVTGTSFTSFTNPMAGGGRVAHTLTYLPGATERIVLAGGTASGALSTAQFFSWNSGNPVNSTYPSTPALARSPLQAHAGALLQGNANIMLLKDHTIQIGFTR